MERDQYNLIAGKILDAAIIVHKELGPGLLESVYEHCLIDELTKKGLNVKSQVFLPLVYQNKKLEKDFKIDLLVENEIIIEIKCLESVLKVHEAQILSYLKLADKRLGLLINFRVALLKNGFRRFVNKF